MNSLLPARGESDSLKSFQLPDRPRGAARTLMYVQLHHRISVTLTRVRYLRRDLDRSTDVRRGCHGEMVEAERRVAQAVAERIQRSALDVPVTGLEIGCRLGKLGEVVVVVDRHLPGGARPAYRQVTRGIGVAEQNV